MVLLVLHHGRHELLQPHHRNALNIQLLPKRLVLAGKVERRVHVQDIDRGCPLLDLLKGGGKVLVASVGARVEEEGVLV